MVAGITVLDDAQVAIEGTRGTLTPAIAVLDMDPGGAVLKRDPTIIRIRHAGSLATSHRSYPGRDMVSIEVSGSWTYNFAPFWFNLFLGPLAAGVGAAADKVWAFVAPSVISDSADNLKSASFELGGRDARPSEYKVAGVMGQSLSLSIRQDGVWTYKATLIGQLVTLGAKTAALSAAAGLVDVLGTTTKIFLDPVATAFGTTQKVASAISADIDIKVGAAARFTLDGTRAATRMAVTSNRVITAKVVCEYNAQTDYTAVQAGTAQRLRIESTGPILGGSFYKQTIDIPGTWDSFDMGNDDGVVTEELALTAQYDATPGGDIAASVTTASLTILPVV